MQPYRIAVVTSQFNQEITSLMERNTVERLKELNIKDYRVVQVPGAVELPIIAKKLALEGYEAVIVLGVVIRGETSHYDYVCNQVSYGCQKVSLEQMTPVIFGVLTCETEAQAYDRIGGLKGNKPKEMVDTAVTMIDLLR
jgi:6,7-dimethyl-8-ribityllumazine synthase